MPSTKKSAGKVTTRGLGVRRDARRPAKSKAKSSAARPRGPESGSEPHVPSVRAVTSPRHSANGAPAEQEVGVSGSCTPSNPALYTYMHTPSIALPPGDRVESSESTQAPCSIQLGQDSPGMVIENPSDPRETLTTFTEGLGANIAQNIREKIINGEYIELGSLLPEQAFPSQINPLTLSGVNASGQLVFKDKTPKQIRSIETWTSVFIIYMSIYLTRHPEKLQAILKYMDIIRTAAYQFGGEAWRIYNINFRQRMSRSPNKPWDIIDGELWLTIMLPRIPVNSSGSGPVTSRYQTKQANVKQGYCRAFNSATCSWKNCKFLHKCSSCGLGHPSSKCTRSQTPGTSRGGNDRFRSGQNTSEK